MPDRNSGRHRASKMKGILVLKAISGSRQTREKLAAEMHLGLNKLGELIAEMHARHTRVSQAPI